MTTINETIQTETMIVCDSCGESKPENAPVWSHKIRHGDDAHGFCHECSDQTRVIDYLTRTHVLYPDTNCEAIWTIEVIERGAPSAPLWAKHYEVRATRQPTVERPDGYTTAHIGGGDPKLRLMAMIAQLEGAYSLRDKLNRDAYNHPLYKRP